MTIDPALRDQLLQLLDAASGQMSAARWQLDQAYQALAWKPWWQDLTTGSQVKAALPGGCEVYATDRVTLWSKRATWLMTLTAPPLPDGAGGAWLQVARTTKGELWVKASDVVAATE